ncbi:hypothetical protein ZEAMMB73_Zm00001d035405 [Zea mays]|jgi:hypothetical protein|uniref:Uncharacterized protein n=1 Tax=Zea mays TaxID=4577 RepID=A0A1D6LGA4_MAIZE|nr:hypothetical protein ZEAMMB73_Zm00001d035405 [Zea mays]
MKGITSRGTVHANITQVCIELTKRTRSFCCVHFSDWKMDGLHLSLYAFKSKYRGNLLHYPDIGLLSQIVIKENRFFRWLKYNKYRGNCLILECRLMLKECLEQT